MRHIAENTYMYEFVVTEWEVEFANSVGRRYGRDDELSDKQRAVADRIFRKVKKTV